MTMRLGTTELFLSRSRQFRYDSHRNRNHGLNTVRSIRSWAAAPDTADNSKLENQRIQSTRYNQIENIIESIQPKSNYCSYFLNMKTIKISHIKKKAKQHFSGASAISKSSISSTFSKEVFCASSVFCWARSR